MLWQPDLFGDSQSSTLIDHAQQCATAYGFHLVCTGLWTELRLLLAAAE